MENTTGLVPGVDYPRTFQEVDEWFRTDAACRGYIRRLRWPGGFICPFCGWTGEPWETSRGLLHCRGCQGQTSLTAGTIFQDHWSKGDTLYQLNNAKPERKRTSRSLARVSRNRPFCGYLRGCGSRGTFIVHRIRPAIAIRPQTADHVHGTANVPTMFDLSVV